MREKLLPYSMASARKNLQKGMQELQEVWDTKIGSQFNHKAKQRSAIAVALTPVPHIIMLAFTGFVTWISWPGSSESIALHVTYFKCIYSFFSGRSFLLAPNSDVSCCELCSLYSTLCNTNYIFFITLRCVGANGVKHSVASICQSVCLLMY